MSPEVQPEYPAKPMTPHEVVSVKAESLPDEVFIAVNGLIAERLSGTYARFTVKALQKRMVELGLDGKEIRERNWDRVGSVYKQAGWKVNYFSPHAESLDFDPYYTFDTNGPRNW